MLNLPGHPRGCHCTPCLDFDDDMRADATQAQMDEADAEDDASGEYEANHER